MSKIFVRIAAILLVFAVFVSAQTESRRYAVITQTGGVVVRQTIEPGANMVMMAREGQRFEILSEGKLWLRVNTQNGEGYIPISACRIRDNGLNPSPVGAVILLLILLGAVGGGAYLYYTKKKAVVEGEDGEVPL